VKVENRYDCNEIRAKKLLKKYGFNFESVSLDEIRRLLNDEIDNYIEGSSEYLRVLCGYLFCIGKLEDVELMEKVKYSINMDVGTMIDGEWLDSMKSVQKIYTRSREELVSEFISYYKSYFSL